MKHYSGERGYCEVRVNSSSTNTSEIKVIVNELLWAEQIPLNIEKDDFTGNLVFNVFIDEAMLYTASISLS